MALNMFGRGVVTLNLLIVWQGVMALNMFGRGVVAFKH